MVRKVYNFGYLLYESTGKETNIINELESLIIKGNPNNEINEIKDIEIIGLTIIANEDFKNNLFINGAMMPLLQIKMGEDIKYTLSLENISLKELIIKKAGFLEFYVYYL